MKPLAVEVRGLTKTYPGRRASRAWYRLRRLPRRGLRTSGAQRRRQVPPPSACSPGRWPRPPGTPASPAGDVVTEPLAARVGRGAVVFQESVVDRPLTGRRNLEIHARFVGRRARGRPGARLPRGSSRAFGPWARSSTDRWPATAAGQRRRLELARAIALRPAGPLSSMRPTVGLDPPHPPRAPRSHSGAAAGGDEMTVRAHDALPRRGRAAVRPRRDHPRRSHRRPRHAGGAAGNARVPSCSRCTSTETLAPRSRCSRAGGVASEDAFSVGGTLTVPAARVAGACRGGRGRRARPDHDRAHDPAGRRSTTSISA